MIQNIIKILIIFIFITLNNERCFSQNPKFKEKNTNLIIGELPNEKTYKLQTEKLWNRWNLPIKKIHTHLNGEYTLIVKNPITGSLIKTKIRKKNVNKIIKGSKKNKKEITVKNLEGRTFYLVKIN